MNTSQRHVCFAADAKKHDGHSPAAQYFEDFIAHVTTFEVFTERDLIAFLKSRPKQVKLLPSLVRKLHRLATKLGTSSRKYVRILPATKTLKLPRSYFQWSVKLYNMVVILCRRFTGVLESAPSSTVHSKRKRNMIEADDKSKVCPSAVYSKRKLRHITMPNHPSAFHSTCEKKNIVTQGIRCCS